jgi:hypothetical protein
MAIVHDRSSQSQQHALDHQRAQQMPPAHPGAQNPALTNRPLPLNMPNTAQARPGDAGNLPAPVLSTVEGFASRGNMREGQSIGPRSLLQVARKVLKEKKETKTSDARVAGQAEDGEEEEDFLGSRSVQRTLGKLSRNTSQQSLLDLLREFDRQEISPWDQLKQVSKMEEEMAGMDLKPKKKNAMLVAIKDLEAMLHKRHPDAIRKSLQRELDDMQINLDELDKVTPEKVAHNNPRFFLTAAVKSSVQEKLVLTTMLKVVMRHFPGNEMKALHSFNSRMMSDL